MIERITPIDFRHTARKVPPLMRPSLVAALFAAAILSTFASSWPAPSAPACTTEAAAPVDGGRCSR